jgi:hypothetical protein
MKKIILILPLCITKISVFLEIVNNFMKILTDYNISSELHILDPNITHNFDDNQLYIMYATEDFINYPKKFICMQFEQLNARINYLSRNNYEDFKNTILNKFKKALYIFDYSYANANFLKNNNILNVIELPYSYTSSLSYNVQPTLLSERKIDILFYGNVNTRRKRILKKMKKINIVIKNSNLWDNNLKELGKISFDKTNLIKYTKIVLNIKYDDPSYSIIETPRIIHAISNGCLVISESSSDCKLNNQLKENIVICHHTQIEDMCLFYLSNPNILQKKIDKTYNWLINKYKYTIPIELINLIK